jgi:PAS domain S-box-containing protein
MKKLKNKILLGLIFLLLVIFLLSITGIISIYYLSQDSKAIIKDNYASVEYSNKILDALEDIFSNQLSIFENVDSDTNLIKILKESFIEKKKLFEKNLLLQKGNITEPGEDNIVNKVIVSYQQFISLDDSLNHLQNYISISQLDELKSKYNVAAASIKEIYNLNMVAIFRKNSIANRTADNVSLYMAIAATASILLTIIFILYFPSYITSPIRELTQKIEDISNKKYDQRINIQSNNEFSTLATAFNKMALKLKEYEAKHIDELLLEKRRMETLVVNLQDGTLLLDTSFRILHANYKFCELTGLTVTELLGQKITELGNDNEILAQINSIDIKNVQANITEKIKPVRIIINDRAEYFQILLLDISKVTRKEVKSEPSGYILLIQNITKYQERDLAKTNLIATISHELKTPLFSINLSVKLLEDGRIGILNEEQKGLAESIKLHSNRILSLVNEVLDFTQAETGHIKLRLRSCDVNDIIELGTFAILMHLNEKEIELDLSIPENLPKVKCDLEKTVWVVVNILNNAVRYSLLKGKITILAKEENEFVVISIKDEGPGITKEEQKRIFEKYVKSKSDSLKGTGLGLAIAKEFVEVQGGVIGIESTPGEGSNFYFSLPIA